jgi:hypothetical protein
LLFSLPRFLEIAATTVALQELLPPFDRNQGNKKKAEIMIQSFEESGREAALGANPWLVIHLNLSGLNTTDEKKEVAPPREPA